MPQVAAGPTPSFYPGRINTTTPKKQDDELDRLLILFDAVA